MSYIGNEPVVSATRTITEVVASGGQTVFYPNGGYTVGYLDVAVNGSLLQASDFVATNGTSVTLNVACASGDDVKLIAWGTFTASSSYTQAQIDSKIGASQFGFKNRLINGHPVIDQRNNGASVTPSGSGAGTYTVDRWCYQASQTGKFTVQQNAGSVTPPVGFSKYLGLTVASAVTIGAGDYFGIYQAIEGQNVADLAWGTANAATVTLSFWVRSSLTGTFGGSIENGNSDRSYPFTYTISSANTWEQKTVTITGDQSGTWLTTNGVGIYVRFGLGVGSTYSGTAGAWTAGDKESATGAVSVVGTAGATFYITGVQLEKGSTATSFDYRPYGTELALCQRYYQTFLVDHRYYPSSTSGYWSFTYSFNVNMRTTPVTTQSGGAVLNMVGGGFQDITALGSNSMRLQSNPIAANSDTYALSRVITASAEL